MVSKPTIYYFPIRGRAEVPRLALAAKHVDFDEVAVDYVAMKEDKELYPFGQCPAFADGDLKIAQSNTIIRYLGRKYNLLGTTESEQVVVDMIMEVIESIRMKYVPLIYVTQLSNKDEYFTTHIDKGTANGRNGGAHFAYLDAFVSKNAGKNYAVGTGLTIADLGLFDIVDLHIRIYGDQFKQAYPQLVQHFEFVAGLPGIKEYLASPKRHAKPNNSALG